MFFLTSAIPLLGECVSYSLPQASLCRSCSVHRVNVYRAFFSSVFHIAMYIHVPRCILQICIRIYAGINTDTQAYFEILHLVYCQYAPFHRSQSVRTGKLHMSMSICLLFMYYQKVAFYEQNIDPLFYSCWRICKYYYADKSSSDF